MSKIIVHKSTYSFILDSIPLGLSPLLSKSWTYYVAQASQLSGPNATMTSVEHHIQADIINWIIEYFSYSFITIGIYSTLSLWKTNQKDLLNKFYFLSNTNCLEVVRDFQYCFIILHFLQTDLINKIIFLDNIARLLKLHMYIKSL